MRTDGGLALTIMGAQYLLENSKQFWENCVKPMQEAVPFVSEGRSLFVSTSTGVVLTSKLDQTSQSLMAIVIVVVAAVILVAEGWWLSALQCSPQD